MSGFPLGAGIGEGIFQSGRSHGILSVRTSGNHVMCQELLQLVEESETTHVR